MINGLINGITGMIGKVMSTVSNLAKGVTDKIKGILKIKSPSRVFRDFGGYIGEGLAIGIDKSRSLVEKTSQGLAESAMIDPVDVGSSGMLAGESLASQVPSDPATQGGGSGSGVTTNYQAPLMQIENYYDNSDNDKREIANGLYRMQQDHDRARGKRT
jgi:phage-related protein